MSRVEHEYSGSTRSSAWRMGILLHQRYDELYESSDGVYRCVWAQWRMAVPEGTAMHASRICKETIGPRGCVSALAPTVGMPGRPALARTGPLILLALLAVRRLPIRWTIAW